jgi:comEA protein
MVLLDKKGKIILFALIFVLIVAAGTLIEHFEKDAFVMETVASDDGAQYSSEAQSVTDGKININSADNEELKKLSGIGDALAERIIKYRTENGPFGSVEEIMKVSGISQKKFDVIKDDICAE